MRGAPAAKLDLERVEALLQKACGLSLSPALRRGLLGSFHRAAEAQELSPAHFAERLWSGDPECVACLVESSVVGETYFFRHPEQFDALHERLGRDFADCPALTIWSAGCATGEEPYSLSMALSDAGRDKKGDRILATDVSQRALRTAKEAVYGKWSLRRVEPGTRARHFEHVAGDRWQVGAVPRRRVELRRHNLVCEPPPIAGCQLVFCRNVLIYFTPDLAARVLRSLSEALVPGGYLVLGPVEVPQAATLPLEWIESAGATLLRKPLLGEKPTPRLPARRVSKAAPVRGRQSVAKAVVASPAQAPATVCAPTRFELAREAARMGRLEEAEKLAQAAARSDLSPESFLLLSMAAESRGDLAGAVEQVRRALYLDPTLATGHALLVALFQRLGRPNEAERSRRNALQALDGLDEAAVLKGVEAITAGALRRALEQPARR
jgi:chemotaxis protein methyltransferase CheR